VFEDDLQLSPYYFVWARSAVEKYYQGGQRRLHERLLAAVREHIATNGTATGPPDAGRDAGVGADASGTGAGTGVGTGMEADAGTGAEASVEAAAGVESDPDSPHALLSPMQRFARNSAGKPLLYGVCLQKQHLQPNHYPRPLQVLEWSQYHSLSSLSRY
jgi:hypothetical protein